MHDLILHQAANRKFSLIFEDFILSDIEIGEAINKVNNSAAVDPKQHILHVEPMHAKVPDHVLSIKCLSGYKRNAAFDTPCLDSAPSSMKDTYNNVPQPIDLGENNIPEYLKPKKDLLLEEIRRFKNNARKDTLTDSIRKALNNVEEELRNIEPGQGVLKKRQVETRGVNSGNIIDEKWLRTNSDWPITMVVKDK
jgi:hypothetical protein